MTDDTTRLETLGDFIRAQRRLANLSLRQMAELAHVSNPYLSQLERGLHEPSVRVLQSIAEALDLAPEVLLEHMGAPVENGNGRDGHETERAIRADDRLTGEQKQAMLSVYRSYLLANAATNGGGSGVSADV